MIKEYKKSCRPFFGSPQLHYYLLPSHSDHLSICIHHSIYLITNPDQEKKVEITTMEGAGEILVVPFFGTGHLNPAMELCKNISSHNYDVTLIIASHLSSSIPSTFTDHSPFIHVAEIFDTPPQTPGSATEAPPKGDPIHDQNEQMGEGIKSFLSTRSEVKPIFVLDVMMLSINPYIHFVVH